MIEQLLNACIESFAEQLDSAEARALFYGLCEGKARDEMLDCLTAEVIYRLRLQVAYPSRLILSLN